MLLSVESLSVAFTTPDGPVRAVSDLSFGLDAGETLGLVGESGSGKSQTGLAIMGLLAANGQASGRVVFDGADLLALPEKARRRVRGAGIGMVFQDPMTALNPYLTVERQLTEGVVFHQGLSHRQARAEALRMLDAVGLADAKGRLGQYPHQFSGGQRQRLMIAMALMTRPKLLLADEPTTALDVTVQAQVLRLLKDLVGNFGIGLVLVTHDLGVVADVADRVLVLYGGRPMETGPVAEVLARPRHPYTVGLLAARPRLDGPLLARLPDIPGEAPNVTRQPPGCPFADRCPRVLDRCTVERPAFQPVAGAPGVARACWRAPEDVGRADFDPLPALDPRGARSAPKAMQ